MPEWLTWGIAVIGLLGGSGGFAAYLRARGQNRVEAAKQQTDDRTLLFKDTREWLSYQDAQINNLIARNEALELRLSAQAEKQAAHSAAHTSEIIELQRQDREKAAQIAKLSTQNTEQAAQIQTLTDERQQYIEKLAVVEAQRVFLESEVNILRQDNLRLRELLPPRVEVEKA